MAFALRGRWDVLNETFGSRIRESDAAHAKGLSSDQRLSIVDDLLETVRAAHEAAGNWDAVDYRAWQETLAERRRLIAAFHKFDEVMRGSATPADAD
mgnify:CR=1 FL=1|jgi:hypothetical protein